MTEGDKKVAALERALAASEASLAEVRALLDHRQRQMDAMRRTSEHLFHHTDSDRMLAETLDLARTVLHAGAGSVLLYEPSDDTLVFRHVMGPGKATLQGYVMPSDQGVSGQVFKTGVPALLNDVSADAHFLSLEDLTGYTAQSMVVVAIRIGEATPIGVMTVLNGRRQFDTRDLEVLEVLASVAAAAIQQARLAGTERTAALVHSLGDVSHDIKNMLTPVETGLLTLREILDDAVEGIDGVCGEAEQVAAVAVKRAIAELRTDRGWLLDGALGGTRRIWDRTRQIADAVKGDRTPLDLVEGHLNDVALEIVRDLRPSAKRAGVELGEHLTSGLPASIFDPGQLYNALYNLVHNALGATEPGGQVRLESAVDGQKLVLRVVDTGQGMSEQVRSVLFTDAAISTKPGGSGLGTQIVAGVVERHRGQIEVESEEGVGTRFTIRLPLDPTV
jgi:signal transduction histidine kinase